MGFLDKVPLNGYKTYVGITLIALTLGLNQLGFIDPSLSNIIVQWLTVATGVAVAHKIDKK